MKIIEVINTDLLEEEILKKGFTQRNLADKINYSQSIISMVLLKKRNPSFTLSNSICKVLNCKFDKFFLIKNNYKSN